MRSNSLTKHLDENTIMYCMQQAVRNLMQLSKSHFSDIVMIKSEMDENVREYNTATLATWGLNMLTYHWIISDHPSLWLRMAVPWHFVFHQYIWLVGKATVRQFCLQFLNEGLLNHEPAIPFSKLWSQIKGCPCRESMALLPAVWADIPQPGPTISYCDLQLECWYPN